jgi:negative regulator of sigma E activity
MQPLLSQKYSRIILAIGVWGCLAQAVPNPAWAVRSEILQRIRQCSETTNYRGRVEIIWYHEDGPRMRQNSVTFKAPDRAWIERVNDESQGKVICRRDGNYYERAPGEISFVMKDREYAENFLAPGYNGVDLAEENYLFVKEGLVTMCERPALILKVEADADNRPWYRAWVDRETGLILKLEKYSEERKLFSYEFLEITINLDIPHSLFNITVNNDKRKNQYRFFSSVKAMERELGYPLVRPRFIPDGYLRKKCRLIINEGYRVAHLLFSNGVSTLSFFQRCAASDADLALQIGEMKVTEQQNMTVVRFRTSKYMFTLIGDLGINQMQRLMQAIQQNAENLANQ